MKIFSVPADFNNKSIDKYYDINNKYSNAVVGEVYGQLTEGNIHMSGRARCSLPQVGMKDLEKYVNYSYKRGIKFNYTLNASCFSNYEFTDKGIKEIQILLSDLENIGVNNLTLATPSLIEIVKMIAPKMNIKASAICQIDSVTKVKHYLNLGVERFVIEPSIIREFDILKNMIQICEDKMEVIINDKCLRNCPYKIFHYNQTAHDNNFMAENYYFMSCGMNRSEDLRRYLNLNWIRPEDIKLYENIGIKYFKVEGREFVMKGDVSRLLYSYIEECFDGNLLELLHVFAPYDKEYQPYVDNKALEGYVEGFFRNKVKCSQLCDNCGYCKTFFDKACLFSKDMSYNATEFYRDKNLFLKKMNNNYYSCIE